MATHMDDSVTMDSETSQRMIFLSAVSLEVSGIVRAQTCLAGVFACLALDPEESERIMSFVHDPAQIAAAAEAGRVSICDMERYVLFPRPTGLPTAQGFKLNQMLSLGQELCTSEMGPRRALSSMLRYTPDDGGAAWVRAHAAAAVVGAVAS